MEQILKQEHECEKDNLIACKHIGKDMFLVRPVPDHPDCIALVCEDCIQMKEEEVMDKLTSVCENCLVKKIKGIIYVCGEKYGIVKTGEWFKTMPNNEDEIKLGWDKREDFMVIRFNDQKERVSPVKSKFKTISDADKYIREKVKGDK